LLISISGMCESNLSDSEGGASPTPRCEHEGHLALTGACRDHRPRDAGASTPAQLLALIGACRARHCASDALPAASTLRTMPMPGTPRPADVRVRPRSQSELGSDRSQADVGRGARSALATPAVHRPRVAVPVTKQAAGVPSAWSQSFNHPPRDRADGAMLGRLRPGGGSEGRHPGTPASRSNQAQRPGSAISGRKQRSAISLNPKRAPASRRIAAATRRCSSRGGRDRHLLRRAGPLLRRGSSWPGPFRARRPTDRSC